jgi:hypothetical protein
MVTRQTCYFSTPSFSPAGKGLLLFFSELGKRVTMQKYSLEKAISIILGSIAACLVLFFCLYELFSFLKEKRIHDSRYNIVAIVTRSKTSEKIPSQIFAEILDLSADVPCNLFSFRPKKAAELLKSYGAFRKVKCRIAKPGVVIVEYELRKPYVKIADFENRALDESGQHLFPLYPFYTPKRLPELYLGELDEKRVKASYEILKGVKETIDSSFDIASCDTSGLFSNSANGEIVLVLEKGEAYPERFFLRLSPKHWQEDLLHFKELLPHIAKAQETKTKKQYIIDLRIPQIALVKSEDAG